MHDTIQRIYNTRSGHDVIDLSVYALVAEPPIQISSCARGVVLYNSWAASGRIIGLPLPPTTVVLVVATPPTGSGATGSSVRATLEE